MKKLVIVFVLMVLLICTTCSNNQDTILNRQNDIEQEGVETNDTLISNELNDEDTDTEDAGNFDTSDESSNKSDVIAEEQRLLELSDSIKADIKENIETFNSLQYKYLKTDIDQETLSNIIELIDIDSWILEFEYVEFGVNKSILLENNNEFLSFSDADYVVYSNKGEPCLFKLTESIINELEQLAANKIDESIVDGQQALINHIHQFNKLLVGDLEENYNIPEENIINLSKEQLTNLHSMFNINEWKIQTKFPSLYYEIGLNEIPFRLMLVENDEPVFLFAAKLKDKYLLDIWGGGMGYPNYSFEITEEIYNKLIEFKNDINKL